MLISTKCRLKLRFMTQREFWVYFGYLQTDVRKLNVKLLICFLTVYSGINSRKPVSEFPISRLRHWKLFWKLLINLSAKTIHMFVIKRNHSQTWKILARLPQLPLNFNEILFSFPSQQGCKNVRTKQRTDAFAVVKAIENIQPSSDKKDLPLLQ